MDGTNPNPLTALRESLQLTKVEMATLVGASYPGWAGYEAGAVSKLSPRTIEQLNAAGYDGPGLAAAYLAWRTARAANIKTAIARTATAVGA